MIRLWRALGIFVQSRPFDFLSAAAGPSCGVSRNEPAGSDLKLRGAPAERTRGSYGQHRVQPGYGAPSHRGDRSPSFASAPSLRRPPPRPADRRHLRRDPRRSPHRCCCSNMSTGDIAAVTLVLLGGTVLLAFFFGLYSDGDLQTWASGLTDAPRTLVASLLLAWPVLGVAELVGLSTPGAGRADRHRRDRQLRQPRPRGRPRPGAPDRAAAPADRAGRLGHGRRPPRRAPRTPRRVRPRDRRPGRRRRPQPRRRRTTCRNSARSTSSTRYSSEDDIDRVIIAFSRASHEQLLSCIRTCRDQRVDGRCRAAPLRAPRRRPDPEPDRWPPAAFDRRAAADAGLETGEARARRPRRGARS